MKAGAGFSKGERLLKAADFKATTKLGQRLVSPSFTIFVRKNSVGFCRLGVAVSKRAGKATRRNRLKRLVREFFRLNKDRLPPASDILVVCRERCAVDELAGVTSELGGVLFP